MALPGAVLLHDVDVVQGDVVEVREGHDRRRGYAVSCIWWDRVYKGISLSTHV